MKNFDVNPGSKLVKPHNIEHIKKNIHLPAILIFEISGECVVHTQWKHNRILCNNILDLKITMVKPREWLDEHIRLTEKWVCYSCGSDNISEGVCHNGCGESNVFNAYDTERQLNEVIQSLYHKFGREAIKYELIKLRALLAACRGEYK